MKKIILFFLTFFVIATEAQAQNLLQVYQQAVVSDPTFQQAIAQRLSNQEALPINIGALLPNANVLVTPSVTKTLTSGSAALTADNTQRGYSVQLAITQTIFNFAQFAAVAGAEDTCKQADATLNSAAQSLMLRTASAYFAVLQDEDNLQFIRATKKAFSKQLYQVNQQYKVGLKTITDVYTAQASYDKASADNISAENQLSNDKENLRVITGQFYPKLATLSEKFPLVSPQPNDMEAWVNIAEKQNWAIKAASYNAEAIRQTIKQQFAGHLPTLNVEGNYTVQYTQFITQNAALATPGSSQSHARELSLNLAIPISNGGAIIAQTHQAQYNYQVASEKLELQTRNTINQARQSYLGVTAGISKIEADKQSIKSNVSSLEGMEAGYEVGTETLVNVLNQQQKVFEAQKQYATDRYAYINSLLNLKQAAGTLSQKDLEAINSWLQENAKQK